MGYKTMMKARPRRLDVEVWGIVVLLVIGSGAGSYIHHDDHHAHHQTHHEVQHHHHYHHHTGASASDSDPFPMIGVGYPVYSFRSPFPFSPDSIMPNWIAVGSTLQATGTSPHGTSSDSVRLTPMMQSAEGVFYHQIPARTAAGFDMFFDFTITKGEGSQEPADGLAFWFTEKHPSPGPVHGNEAGFKGLGIIIDTYSNSRKRRHPYLYGWVNDGTPNWVDNRDGEGVELTSGCNLDLNENVRVYVQYKHETVKVAISMSQPHAHHFHCFTAEHVRLDFSAGYFGFSASTGHFFSTHDINQVQIRADPTPLQPNYDTARGGFQYRMHDDPIHAHEPEVPHYTHASPTQHETAKPADIPHEGAHPHGDHSGAHHDNSHHDHQSHNQDQLPTSQQHIQTGEHVHHGTVRDHVHSHTLDGQPPPGSLNRADLKARLDRSLGSFSTEVLSALTSYALKASGSSDAGKVNELAQSSVGLLESITRSLDQSKSQQSVGVEILNLAKELEAVSRELSHDLENLEEELEMVSDTHHDLLDIFEELKDEIQYMREHKGSGGRNLGQIVFVLFMVLTQLSAFFLLLFIRKLNSKKGSFRMGV
mmetsp:Transcript_17455/g.36237  ORF Transcript_17455/g.36237 Transcript_17455/m.36237 type:complete len:592 (-) Transcript_17455:2230-4005(-)